MAPTSSREDIDALIQDVAQASQLPPKARPGNIKPTVATLASEIYDRGLLPDALNELIEIITTPSHLDQGSLNALVRNLYPATRVSKGVVVRVVACLGHGRLKASLNIQAALIRWLILVYHILESPSVLSQTYHVLFSLLDTAATRPQLTHLLALITRRKHIKPFRIQALLNLSRQTGNDPSLVGLLRVYKDYYPEIIVGEAVRGKASAFKHPDPLWRTRLDEIQDAHMHQTQDVVSGPRDGFKVNRPINRSLRTKLVPLVHTSHVNENSVTLEEVENATKLTQSLEKLELPNQLVAVLADPLLQKLLLLRPSEESYQRVANWLHAVLQDVVDGSVDGDTLWDILDLVKDFVIQTKTLPPVVLNFFTQFFQYWDGTGRSESLFAILAYVPLHDFQELYKHIFQPFETAVLAYRNTFPAALLQLYTNLLHQWTVLLQSSHDIPEYASSATGALVRHVNQLALTLIQTSPTVESASAILDFYEHFVSLVTHDRLRNFIRIELPPSTLIYSLFFSSSLSNMSRLCNILACFKRGFETAMATRTQSGRKSQIDALSYDRAYVNLYNGYLMDLCNCLWRSRAFKGEPNSHGCLIPRPTVDAVTSYVSSVDRSSALASIYSLSYSPTLCYQSIQRLRQVEDAALENGDPIRLRHAGPATQASLARLATSGGVDLSWKDYRIGVLNGLSKNSLGGVTELLKCTMTALKNAMEGEQRRTQ